MVFGRELVYIRRGSDPIPAPVILQGEPEPLEIHLRRTAIMVIDMQNAFASKGGVADSLGWGVSNLQKIIEPIKRITSAARAKGVKVVYITHWLSPDLCNTTEPNSPYWYKELPTFYREHPERRDRLIIQGTWGAEIIDELKPQEGDIFVDKPRFSAFSGTDLDAILKTHHIKYLAFVGIATNICVEASIRDAFNLDYFPILISDAAAAGGLVSIQESTIYNVKSSYGWVTTTENLVKALE